MEHICARIELARGVVYSERSIDREEARWLSSFVSPLRLTNTLTMDLDSGTFDDHLLGLTFIDLFHLVSTMYDVS